MKRHNYFVSYAHSKGYGNIIIDTSYIISETAHVRAIEAKICNVMYEPKVIALNWKYLGETDVNEGEADSIVHSTRIE